MENTMESPETVWSTHTGNHQGFSSIFPWHLLSSLPLIQQEERTEYAMNRGTGSEP